MSHGRKIAVIGLGYVGLPVAVAFGRAGAPGSASTSIPNGSASFMPAATAPGRSRPRTCGIRA